MKKNSLSLLIESHLLFEHEFWMRRILLETPQGWDAWQKLQRFVVPAKSVFNSDVHPGLPPILADVVGQRLQSAIETFIKDPAVTPESIGKMTTILQTFSRELFSLFSTESFANVIERIPAESIAKDRKLPLVKLLDYPDRQQLTAQFTAKLKSVSSLAAYIKVTSVDIVNMFLGMTYDDLKELVLDAAKVSKIQGGTDLINRYEKLLSQSAQTAEPQKALQPPRAPSVTQNKDTSVTQIKQQFWNVFQSVPAADRAAIPASVKNSLGSFIQLLNSLEQQEATQQSQQQT